MWRKHLQHQMKPSKRRRQENPRSLKAQGWKPRAKLGPLTEAKHTRSATPLLARVLSHIRFMPRTGGPTTSREAEVEEADLDCFLVHIECKNITQQLGQRQWAIWYVMGYELTKRCSSMKSVL